MASVQAGQDPPPEFEKLQLRYREIRFPHLIFVKRVRGWFCFEEFQRVLFFSRSSGEIGIFADNRLDQGLKFPVDKSSISIV